MQTSGLDNHVDIRVPLPRRLELPHRLAGSELLVTVPETGHVHFLNETAAYVWNCCDGVTTLGDCADRLREEFEAPAEIDVAADVLETIGNLSSLGLLEGDVRIG